MIKAALSLLTTENSWDDLHLTKKAFQQAKIISNQIVNNTAGKRSLQQSDSLSPVLFYGTQNKEQINTAAVIGKINNQPVYSVDLSKLVSQYIGETEKNLNTLFDTAANKNWILFFDEADALFGKRTDVKDAHDKYANQDTSYLLQRIETHPGLILLATNKKSNIDPAFIRRIRSSIYFPKPKKKKR